MKLFASDYDGTLRCGPVVSDEDKDMIMKWRKQGNLFVIVTGRSMESITSELDRNGFACDYIIGNNGGVIYDQHMNRLQETIMDFPSALQVLAYIKTIPCISYVINDGFHRAKVVVDPSKEDRKYGNVAATMSVADILDNKKIAQFVLSVDDMKMATYYAGILNQKFKDIICAYVNVDCIDIVPASTSKAKGVAFLGERHSLAHQDIYTIGDSYNDLPMIEAYQGFSLWHADMVIQKQATYCFESVGQAIKFCIEDVESA